MLHLCFSWIVEYRFLYFYVLISFFFTMSGCTFLGFVILFCCCLMYVMLCYSTFFFFLKDAVYLLMYLENGNLKERCRIFDIGALILLSFRRYFECWVWLCNYGHSSSFFSPLWLSRIGALFCTNGSLSLFSFYPLCCAFSEMM